MRLGNYEISDLQAWLRSRRNHWEKLRDIYRNPRMLVSVEKLTEVLNDCDALAEALEEK